MLEIIEIAQGTRLRYLQNIFTFGKQFSTEKKNKHLATE